MSEKRFKLWRTIDIDGHTDEWGVIDIFQDDIDYEEYLYDEDEVVDLLNEQQATIEEKDKEIEEWEFSFRTEMAHHRVAEKELQEKIREKQAIIDELQANIQYLLDSKKDLLEKIDEQQTRIDLLEKGILDCLFEDKSIGMFALDMGLVE